MSALCVIARVRSCINGRVEEKKIARCIVPISRRFSPSTSTRRFSHERQEREKKEEDRQTARERKRNFRRGIFLVQNTGDMHTHDAPDLFFADQIRGENVALFALPEALPVRAIDT